MSDAGLLFSPIQLGDLELSNRIFMAPMTRTRARTETEEALEIHAEYYAQRASAGLILTEGSPISDQSRGYVGCAGMYTNKHAEGWRRVTDAVHAEGGHIFAQLWHVGRMSVPYFQHGRLPLSASALASDEPVYSDKGFELPPVPKAMSLQEIRATVQDFKHAAQVAKDAGFDGIQLHTANGYIFDQFLQDSCNERTDQYGGSLENRTRFMREVLEAVISVWGDNKVAVRQSPMGLYNMPTVDSDLLNTYEYQSTLFNDYPLAFVEYLELMRPIDSLPAEQQVHEVARHFRNVYRGILVTNAGYTCEKGVEAVAEGIADAVSYGAPYISNPDLVRRFKEGLPLTEADPDTFYGPDEKGYTDYPCYSKGLFTLLE